MHKEFGAAISALLTATIGNFLIIKYNKNIFNNKIKKELLSITITLLLSYAISARIQTLYLKLITSSVLFVTGLFVMKIVNITEIKTIIERRKN